jgi:CRISPR/Cas system CSM-associated protein Csm3 (group 7 of RAMP superfamily)
MPTGENFWNPYRMIPVREKIERAKPLTDEKFQGTSGLISCSLENLTPLFVGKGNEGSHRTFLHRANTPVIPGSSLKGMLRSLAEIAGGGCCITESYANLQENKACSKADRLCIACRMFGMMERGKDARVHKGKISIGDALMQGKAQAPKLFQILLSSCGVRHEPFYRTPQTGTLDGKARKLYFHQPRRLDSVPNVPENLKPRSWYINALVPGHRFDFDIQFSNLSKEELDLLIYVLALEENVAVGIRDSGQELKGPLRHKIGSAKPLGLGSCHITIRRLICLADPKKRFSTLNKVSDSVFEGESLRSEIAKRTEKFAKDSSMTMQQLRKMMVWDAGDPRNFAYPDYNWFKNPANSQKILKEI